MSGRNRQKMVLLSDDTFTIASNMDNFSGWLRARLRQFDEGVDLVEMELMRTYLRLQFKTISEAVELHCTKDEEMLIWATFNASMAQKKLEDFS